MKLDLIKERNTYLFRIISLITIGLLIYFWLLQNHIAFILIPLIQLIPLFISPTYLYKNIGCFEIDSDKIIVSLKSIEETIIDIDEQVRINLFYDSQKASESVKNIFTKGFIVRIQIEKTNEFSEYKVIVKKKEREEFIKFLSNLYRKGINVRERDELGAKMFLLKGNYFFNQIQEIKSEYNLTW